MSNFKTIAGLIALALLAAGNAQADDSNWGVGLKAGTLGLGLEARWAPLPYMDLRLGGNTYTYKTDGRQATFQYDSELNLETYYATANFHFPLTPLRITAGAMANGNELTMASAEPGDFNFGNGDFWLADEVGSLSSTTSFGSTAPYLGIGFDFEIFGKAGINLDFGVLWQGDPEVSLSAQGGSISDDPNHPLYDDLQLSIEGERQELEDEMSDFKAYPVVSLAFVYNF